MNLFDKIVCLLPGRFAIFFWLTACSGSVAWAQSFRILNISVDPDCARQQRIDNEFVNTRQPEGYFYCNPLRLGGGVFNFTDFTLETKGDLKLIKGESKSGKIIEIPFYIYLRRNGILITPSCSQRAIHMKADISVFLKVAQDGDELIIEPANKEDWPAKRIIKILNKC